MFEAQPPRSPGVPVGYALIVTLMLLSAVSIYFLFNRPITLLSFFLGLVAFLSAPVSALVAYWSAALSRARYRLSDDMLQITWGPLHHLLPLQSLQVVEDQNPEGELTSFRGLRWPGYLLGRGQLQDDPAASVTLFATEPPPNTLLVASDQGWYALSPRERDAFREALISAMKDAPNTPSVTARRDSGWLSWPLWHDRTTRTLLLSGILVNAAHFALLTALFPGLPETVPLRVDGAGVVLLTGPASRLFLPPLFGAFTWLANALLGGFFYQRRAEPIVAYLLWGAAVAIQLAAWVSLLLLLP